MLTPRAVGPPWPNSNAWRNRPTAIASGANRRRTTPTTPFNMRWTVPTPTGRWTCEATKKAAVNRPTRTTARSPILQRDVPTSAAARAYPPASQDGASTPSERWTANTPAAGRHPMTIPVSVRTAGGREFRLRRRVFTDPEQPARLLVPRCRLPVRARRDAGQGGEVPSAERRSGRREFFDRRPVELLGVERPVLAHGEPAEQGEHTGRVAPGFSQAVRQGRGPGLVPRPDGGE